MKILSTTRAKSLAAAAAVMMFASSVAFADMCSDTCAVYASQAASQAQASFIASAPSLCANALAQGGQSAYNSCVAAVTAYAPTRYSEVYAYVMQQCTASCRQY